MSSQQEAEQAAVEQQSKSESAESSGLKRNRDEILAEKKALQAENERLKQQIRESQERAGESEKELHEFVKSQEQKLQQVIDENARLQKEQEEAKAAQALQRRTSAFLLAAGAAGAIEPRQLWTLCGKLVRDEESPDGDVVASYGGRDLSLEGLMAELREDARYSHHFKAPQKTGGMGARASGRPVSSSNPYGPDGSLTERITLEMNDPDLAARLKREARKG